MKSEKLIWILEDDQSCLFVYKDILDIRFITKYFTNLTEFTKALKELSPPDLIISDLKLPDGNFLHFLANSDSRTLLTIPFMIISTTNDIDALRFCFSEGAIEYLTKPFDQSEFLVKLERVFLNNSTTNNSKISINLTSCDLELKNFDDLTKKEIDLLRTFIESNNNQVEKKDLLNSVWKNINVHPKTLNVHLYNLRRKLLKYNYQITSVKSGVWKLASIN